MSSSEPQSMLLHYRLVEKIAAGGMGDVYKAADTKLGRTVALKLLPAAVNQDLNAKRRFIKEAQSASALNHPNIVVVHAIEESDGLDFIVMEYVDGPTLKKVIGQDGALPVGKLLDVGIQIADALDAAHTINLIHRDIKSANILITPKGIAKVLDFGLAKSVRHVLDGQVDNEAPTLFELTGEGVVLGTLSYMSPEQTRGEHLDARSDIFSFGAVLYEAATRSLPFPGQSALATMDAIARLEPIPPSRVRPELPPEFDAIIARALQKDRERRYSTAAEMGKDLRDLRSGMTGAWIGPSVVYDRDFIDSSSTPFVGRDVELTKLEEFLNQAVGGNGRVVFITGEPGIGKTSLSDEFLRRARAQSRALMVSRGRCIEQYGTGEAYLPFLDALGVLLDSPSKDRLGSIMRTHAPTWCTQLPAAFSSTGAVDHVQQDTIGATKERMMREMGDALGLFANTSPVVLLLEDLHWADSSSIELLRHLCNRITTQRVLLVGTFRPEDIERSNHPLKSYRAEMKMHRLCEEIPLDSLSREHIVDYLNVTFKPNDFPDNLADHLHEKTEGHPLFTTNLLQYLSERGDIVKANENWTLARPLSEIELEAPESVRSMIGKKVDQLTEEDRRALQYASVEGAEFLSTIVAELLGVDQVDLEERLARLEKTHRLVTTRDEEELPDGALATRYRFSHALYQNFLYGDLVNTRRVMLHKQAGEQLEKHYGKRAPQLAAQLALHFERGRDFDRAIEYLIHAGDNAAKFYGNGEAADHYTHAIELVQKLPPEARAELFATLYQKRGGVNMALGRFAESVDDYASILKQEEALTPAKRASALNALSMTLFFSHRVEEMAVRADEALVAAKEAGSEQLRLDTMILMGLKHLCYGEVEVGLPIIDDVIESARAINYKPALMAGVTWRGCLCFFQTEYERCIEYETEARRLTRDLRDGFLLLTSMFFHGLSLGNLGHFSEALTILHEGISQAGRNGDSFWFPRMPNCIGWIHREMQDFEGALKYDEEGRDVGRERHVLEAEANSLINLGIDHTIAGKHGETASVFAEVRDIFERDKWFRWRYSIRLEAATAEHWLKQGDLAKAKEFTERLFTTASEFKARKYIAVAHKLKAAIAAAEGDFEGARTAINEALTVLAEYPVPVVKWKVLADLGRVLKNRGEEVESRKAFSDALEIVEECASHVTDEQLRSTFMNSEAVKEVVAGSN
jgi:serine/threonine protein kinase/tetratricopeptide (TPR) repeat protein